MSLPSDRLPTTRHIILPDVRGASSLDWGRFLKVGFPDYFHRIARLTSNSKTSNSELAIMKY
jgi:hypothetical protein